MKTGRYILLLAILVVIFGVLYFLSNTIALLKAENHRVTENVNTLTSKLIRYRTADSLKATRVGSLMFRVNELETYNASLTRQVETMGIRLKDVERVSAHGLNSAYRVVDSLKDSIKYLKNSITGKVDTIHFSYINYKDKWITFYQEQTGSNTVTDIKTRDSIVIVQHWEPYKFLGIKYGKKKHWVDVVNYNPYSEITFSLSVIVDKRKKY